MIMKSSLITPSCVLEKGEDDVGTCLLSFSEEMLLDPSNLFCHNKVQKSLANVFVFIPLLVIMERERDR